MSEAMRAARCRGPRDVVIEETERPVPGAGEVVVRVRNCGICGSDLHWYHGRMMVPGGSPGHEIAGEVAEVGPRVGGIREGDAVAVEGVVSCGRCRYCLGGAYNVCPGVAVVGMTVAGGFAEYLRVPARHCFPIPAGVGFANAALAEPLAVTVHGARIAGLGIGQRVLVLGAGTIGLMAVVAARAGGAGEIVVTARHPQQKAAARALGADRVVDSADAGELLDVGQEAPIDIVIETVGGTADTLDTAAAACRPGGTICMLGAFTGSPTLPALFVLAKELTLKGSLTYARAGARADFEVALDILARQGEQIGATVVTHGFPLDAIVEAFRVAGDKTSGSIKVTIAP